VLEPEVLGVVCPDGVVDPGCVVVPTPDAPGVVVG